jgi:hypothetical protein
MYPKNFNQFLYRSSIFAGFRPKFRRLRDAPRVERREEAWPCGGHGR